MVYKNQKNVEIKKPDIRYLSDMKKVLYDREWAKKAPDSELYYMYRGLKQKAGLRYDITVIPPKMMGREFVKTKGHEHSGKYGELYTVLEGKALYLLQKYEKNKIKDVYAVKAEKGDSVIVPPGYGHITINPSKKKLAEGNWLCERCQNIYGLFEKKRGACYYYLKNGWVKNKNYGQIPALRFKKPLNRPPKNLNFLYGG